MNARFAPVVLFLATVVCAPAALAQSLPLGDPDEHPQGPTFTYDKASMKKTGRLVEATITAAAPVQPVSIDGRPARFYRAHYTVLCSEPAQVRQRDAEASEGRTGNDPWKVGAPYEGWNAHIVRVLCMR